MMPIRREKAILGHLTSIDILDIMIVSLAMSEWYSR